MGLVRVYMQILYQSLGNTFGDSKHSNKGDRFAPVTQERGLKTEMREIRERC